MPAKFTIASESDPPLVERQSLPQKLCILLTFRKVDGRDPP
jgi:hypothetical protein